MHCSKKSEKDGFFRKGETWSQDHRQWLFENTGAEHGLFQALVLSISFQLHGKSHGPLSLHAIKYLTLSFINGVQRRGRDYETSAADGTVIVGR